MPTRSFTGICHRCGIEHSCSENTRIEWRDYCKDCRHEAKTLGWIPRSRKLAA